MISPQGTPTISDRTSSINLGIDSFHKGLILTQNIGTTVGFTQQTTSSVQDVHQTQTFTHSELDDIPVGTSLTQRITELNKTLSQNLNSKKHL